MRDRTISFIVTAAAWMRRNRRIEVRPGITKVNLGAGLTVAPGWINIDLNLNALVATLPSWFLSTAYKLFGGRSTQSLSQYRTTLSSGTFVHHDLRFGIPLASATVDFVYCSHFLEHLSMNDASDLLRDIHRVLKPGGRVRLVVPDMAHVLSLWERGEKHEALRLIFNPGEILGLHRYMYDEGTLTELLASLGFAEPKRCRYRQGLVPDLEVLDTRPDHSLFIEASK